MQEKILLYRLCLVVAIVLLIAGCIKMVSSSQNNSGPVMLVAGSIALLASAVALSQIPKE